jgi:uncharacterized membrane protein
MNRSLSARTAILLTIPPILWAGNAVVGRMVHTLVPPMTLNLLRWLIALLILLPLAGKLWQRGSGLLRDWKRYALLGLLGIGLYNSLQYLALQSSTPINVTLVAASMPVWMLLVGALFFGVRITRRQAGGAVLSICGVVLVLSRGQWQQLLALRLVPGDLFMLLATLALVVLQLAAHAPRGSAASARRLGRLPGGPGAVWRFVVRAVCRRGVERARDAHHMDAVAVGGLAVRGGGPGRDRVSLLGRRGAPGRSERGRFFRQPDPVVRRHPVGGIPGRGAAPVSRRRFRPDRRRYRVVGAERARIEDGRRRTVPVAQARRQPVSLGQRA